MSGSPSSCVSTLKWGKILCCIISLHKKEWKNIFKGERNVHNLMLSGKHAGTEWEWGYHENVMKLNEQHERQKTSSYIFSMGNGNEQGNLTLI